MKTLARVYRHHFVETSFAFRRAADEPQEDLVRVAARGAGFLADTMARLASDKLTRTGSRPLLLLNSAPVKHYRRILVATDFSETSGHAAGTAVHTFPGVQIVFLHAYHVSDRTALRDADYSFARVGSRRSEARESAAMELDRFVDTLRVERQLTSRVVRLGAPVRVICDYARTMAADLIVIGNPAQSRLNTLLHGSATRRLMDETGCDLLIAPAQKR